MLQNALSLTDLAAQVPTSMGCGIPQHFVGGQESFTIESGGHNRSYTVHLPENYHDTEIAPLLILYHPAHADPGNFERFIGLTRPEINKDMIIVYPDGVDGLWDGPHYPRWEQTDYQRPDVDDFQFTKDLLDQLESDFCVDRSRIYASGHSAGASFSTILACDEELSARFAAFAVVSTPVYTDLKADEGCHPARSPIPMFAAHSRDDPIAPFLGGQGHGGPVASIPGWMARWAKRNNCGPPQPVQLSDDIRQTSCDGPDQPNLQRLVEVSGETHAWPRAEEGFVDVTAMIVEFVSNHSIPGPWGDGKFLRQAPL